MNPSFFFAYFYRRLFRSCGFQEGRIADKTSFSGKILPLRGCGDFPGNPCGLNLTFQDAGLPLPQDTYRTGVLEIHCEGSRFGFPSSRLAPQEGSFALPVKHHKEMIHGSVLLEKEYRDG